MLPYISPLPTQASQNYTKEENWEKPLQKWNKELVIASDSKPQIALLMVNQTQLRK